MISNQGSNNKERKQDLLADLLRHVVQGVELVAAHNMAFAMEMRCSDALMLHTASQRGKPSESTPERPHVVPELVLAST